MFETEVLFSGIEALVLFCPLTPPATPLEELLVLFPTAVEFDPVVELAPEV